MTDMTTPKRRKRQLGAVAKCIEVMDSMLDAKRHTFLAECDRLGLNPNTAKTQWDRRRAVRHQGILHTAAEKPTPANPSS